eukprot:gene1156-12044_t
MAAPGLYSSRGPIQCAAHILKVEGLRGMFKGLTANIVRLCPAIMIQMPIMEQMRIVAGLDFFGKI